MARLSTAQVTKQFNVSRFALGRAGKSGILKPMRDNKGGLLYDEDEIRAWLDERPAHGAHGVRAQDSELVSAQAHITALAAELSETKHKLQVTEERLAGAERLLSEKDERIEEHRLRAAAAEARADKAEARADRAEKRADRATDDVRTLSAQAKRRRWWPFT